MPTDQAFLDSLRVRPIGRDIDLSGFDCDSDNAETGGGINAFLKEQACEHHEKRMSAVTCWLSGGDVAGYMTTSMGYTRFTDSPWWSGIGLLGIKFTRQGKDEKQFPAVLIGMLGVDKRFLEKGLAKVMVGEALSSALEAAPKIGCRIVHVDSLRTPSAIGLYTKMGFTMADKQEKRGKAWMYFDLKARPANE